MLPDQLSPDDGDEKKVRRNLVAFCSAVLLLAWLGVPLSIISGKLMAPELPVDPLRAWIAAAAVLLYLAVQFHFNGGGQEAAEKLQESYRTGLASDVYAMVLRQSHAGKLDDWWTPTGAEAVAGTDQMLAERTPQSPWGRLLRIDLQPGSRWSTQGRAMLKVLYTSPPSSDKVIFQHELPLEYALPPRVWVSIVPRRCWLTWGFSQQAMAWVLPAFLAITASYLVGFRIGTALV
jgi:hypothetical protein